MRVVSWNVNHWQRREPDRWARLVQALNELEADVALLQEALPPPAQHTVFYPISETNRHLRWGTAVVALRESVQIAGRRPVRIGSASDPADIEISRPGTLAVADVIVGSASVCTVASVYGQQIAAGNGTKYASTTVHRVISDLVPLLDSSRNGHAKVLVAGDLNVTTQWDKSATDREMDRSVFDRMKAHGFTELVSAGQKPGHQVDCFCVDAGDCLHIRTLRWRDLPDSRPWQTDYVFASASLVATATVIDNDRYWALSDHAPIVVDLSV